MKRYIVAAGFLVSISPLALSQALAQGADRGRNETVRERARPELDPLGVRAGSFLIRPQVVVAAEYNDNVFAVDDIPDDPLTPLVDESSTPEEDTVITVRPTVTVNSTWSRHALRLGAGADTTYHQDFDSEDRTNSFVNGEFRLDVYREASVSVGGGYRQNTEPRTAAESSDLFRDQVEYTVGDVFVGGVYVFNRLRVSGRVQRTSYDFDDVNSTLGPVDQDYRDRDETVETLRFEYGLSPQTALVFQASANQREYDVQPPAVPATQDSSGYEYLFGVNTDLTNLLRGEMTVGWYTQEYDDPARDKAEGLAVRANVDYFLSDLTTVTFDASRSIDESGVTAGGVETTHYGIRVDHELLRNVILTAGAARSEYEYNENAVDRTDEATDFDVGATYWMNRNVGIGVGYFYTDYQSDGVNAGRNFEVNRAQVSLTLRI